MKRFALLIFGSSISACTGLVRFHAVDPAPPPPPPAVAVTVAASAGTDSPAPPVAGGDTPTATDDAGVEAATEVAAAEPEAVTATTEPPDPIYEEQTDAPALGYFWVAGHWGWTGSDWAWTPGGWSAAPEGRVYIEPYYERVGPNVVYVGGYWGPRDAPRRSYGGERLRFAEARRPADYRRGEYRRFERRAGAPPGSRPAGSYERATGAPRSLPHATTPAYRERETAAAHAAAEPREPVAARGPVVADKASAPREPPGGNRDQRFAPAQHQAPPAHAPAPPTKKKK